MAEKCPDCGMHTIKKKAFIGIKDSGKFISKYKGECMNTECDFIFEYVIEKQLKESSYKGEEK